MGVAAYDVQGRVCRRNINFVTGLRQAADKPRADDHIAYNVVAYQQDAFDRVVLPSFLVREQPVKQNQRFVAQIQFDFFESEIAPPVPFFQFFQYRHIYSVWFVFRRFLPLSDV